MYPCENFQPFQSICRTLDSETKFDKNILTKKTFEKNKH